MANLNPHRTFVLRAVSEYVENPDKFLADWEDPDGRRALLKRLAVDNKEPDPSALLALIDEDLPSLSGQTAVLAAEVISALNSSTSRYAGNRIYLEEAGPTKAATKVDVAFTATIWEADGKPGFHFNAPDGGRKEVDASCIVSAAPGKWSVKTTVNFATAGAWAAVATAVNYDDAPERFDKIAIIVT